MAHLYIHTYMWWYKTIEWRQTFISFLRVSLWEFGSLRSVLGVPMFFIVSVSCNMGLVVIWSWSWLGLALLWSRSWLGPGLGGLDYNIGYSQLIQTSYVGWMHIGRTALCMSHTKSLYHHCTTLLWTYLSLHPGAILPLHDRPRIPSRIVICYLFTLYHTGAASGISFIA